MKGLEDQEGISDKIGESPLAPDGVEKDSRVLVLPVNGESRKITQILSNGTSLKILELLGEKSMSATDIAEKLDLPLTTVKYNLDSLVESDLIKVKQIRWSQKGRQVKIYESMEKLIVLIPSKSSIDRLSIINMLQKYIGVIAAAFFASAGIEYFSAYMQAKKIFDASAPIRMAKNESAGASSQAVITETNVSSNFTTKSVLVQQTPDSGTMSASYETANAGTENVSTGMGSGPTTGTAGVQAVPASATSQVSAPAPVNTATAVNATAVSAPAPVNAPTAVNATAVSAPAPVNAPAHNVTNSVYNTPSNPPSVSPESLAHVGGGHGLYDALSLHPGVWFLFGCIFIILLLIVREIYYKKRAK